VHPPKEVSDAFKDVASAREDKSRITNEAEAYRNDLLPKARGEAAQYVNQAEGYKQSVIRRAEGDAARFLSVLKEYDKAKDVTRERLYLETMEEILSNPDVEKILLSDKVAGKALPLLPLKGGSGLGADVLAAPARPAPSKGGMN
jgi:membrane protease subunit HflK